MIITKMVGEIKLQLQGLISGPVPGLFHHFDQQLSRINPWPGNKMAKEKKKKKGGGGEWQAKKKKRVKGESSSPITSNYLISTTFTSPCQPTSKAL